MSKFNELQKKAFFFWGHSPMPYLNSLCIQSFKKYNPEWRTILYRPTTDLCHEHKCPACPLSGNCAWERNEGFTYRGDDYTNEAEAYADEKRMIDYREIGHSNDLHIVQKADILRQYLMYNEGGLWSDMDILFIRPIGLGGIGADIAISYSKYRKAWRKGLGGGYYSTGVVYAKKGTKFYKEVLYSIPKQLSRKKYQSAGPDLIRYLYPNIADISHKHPELRVYNIPMHVFYPIHYDELERLFEQNDGRQILKGTTGIHWYGGAKMARKHKPLINDINLHKYEETTIGKLIIEVLSA